MRLIGEDYEVIEASKALDKKLNVVDKHYWEYSFKKRDFHLTKRIKWLNIKGPVFVVKIGKNQVTVPANHFIMIGDFEAGLDFIRMDEIINRSFDVFTFSSDMDPDSAMLLEMKVVGFEEERRMVFPETKNAVVVNIGDNRCALFSTYDHYSRVKDLTFADFV